MKFAHRIRIKDTSVWGSIPLVLSSLCPINIVYLVESLVSIIIVVVRSISWSSTYHYWVACWASSYVCTNSPICGCTHSLCSPWSKHWSRSLTSLAKHFLILYHFVCIKSPPESAISWKVMRTRSLIRTPWLDLRVLSFKHDFIIAIRSSINLRVYIVMKLKLSLQVIICYGRWQSVASDIDSLVNEELRGKLNFLLLLSLLVWVLL